MSKVISDAKKNAHPSGSITANPSGVADPDAGMEKPVQHNLSARQKRRPAIIPKKG